MSVFGEHELSVRISEIDKGPRLEEVRAFLEGNQKYRVIIGQEEVGEQGIRHLQLAVRSKVTAQTLRKEAAATWPALKGETGGNRSQGYAFAAINTTFVNVASYCLKGLSYEERTTSSGVMLKGLSAKDISEIPLWIADAKAETTYIGKLKQYVVRETLGKEYVSDTDYSVLILWWHRQNTKKLPVKHQLRDLTITVRAMMMEDQQVDRYFQELAHEAMRL